MPSRIAERVTRLSLQAQLPRSDHAEFVICDHTIESLHTVLDTTREKDEPEAIHLAEAWLLNLAVQNNQLLTEQSVLDDQFRFAPGTAGCGGKGNRMTGWLGEMQEGLFRGRKQTNDQLGEVCSAFRRVASPWDDPVWQNHAAQSDAPIPSPIRVGRIQLPDDANLGNAPALFIFSMRASAS